jgi:hypothetical protein
LALKDYKVQPEQMARLAPQAHKALKGWPERLVPQAHRDYKDFKGYLEQTEQLDLLARQEQ